MLYICVMFRQDIWNSFQVTEQTQVQSRNGYFQYLRCSKGHNSKSRFTSVMVFVFCTLSHSALHLCTEKFHNNILNGFQLTKLTWVDSRNGLVQCSKGNYSKSRQTRVTVHVFCTSCITFVWSFVKYLGWYKSYGVDTNDGSAEGRTDGWTYTQNFRCYNIIPLPLFVAGHKYLNGQKLLWYLC